jgi:3,4-dihydroxy 2-butanone 4-phosphate synthase/GTP cyclohydrolase II
MISPIEEIIEEARKGRMFILVDEEDRENEGDLVMPAALCTPEHISFMARHGRGLICLALEKSRVDTLGLPLVARADDNRRQTAFTVSIEARDGITTGISAADRARTIAVAIDPDCGPREVTTPGHVFPLAARDGGTLVRAGHTEAAVDIARLAGLNPSGVICEIMKDDGSMARLPDLIPFAQQHNLKIGTIADLIAYRRRTEKLVERIASTSVSTKFGGPFTLHVYATTVNYQEHAALVMGDLSTPEPVLVRMHTLNLLDDVLGDPLAGRGDDLDKAIGAVAAAGRGVIVILRERSPKSLSERVKSLAPGGKPFSPSLRVYGVGAQILLDLGVREMILLSHARRSIVGIEGFGLSVVETRPLG